MALGETWLSGSISKMGLGDAFVYSFALVFFGFASRFQVSCSVYVNFIEGLL